MINEILFILLLNILLCAQFQELQKYDYIYAIPNNWVYLDISSFEVGESIYLEFSMNLIFSKESKESYTFKIAQVPAKSGKDYQYWSTLPTVTNRNYTVSSGFDYNYTWVEIKQPGMNYIYIIPLEPFEKFYTFWKFEIFLINTGGMSQRELMRRVSKIVFPCFAVIIVAIIIFYIYYKKKKKNNVYPATADYPPAFPVSEQATSCPQVQENLVNEEQQEYEKPIDNVIEPPIESIN